MGLVINAGATRLIIYQSVNAPLMVNQEPIARFPRTASTAGAIGSGEIVVLDYGDYFLVALRNPKANPPLVTLSQFWAESPNDFEEAQAAAVAEAQAVARR